MGEIRIGEEVNPTITVQLSGVDTESIIEQARREDNQGNRIRRVRQMLFEQIGIEGEGEFEQYHEFWWRNTKRSCAVLFRNIRELPDSSLENADEGWKLVIDFPFDEAGHGPRDDLSTIQRFSQSHPDGAKTLCWMPSFFSADAQKDLGMLVILEHILTGERFLQYANHLSPQDRQAAKSLLENQRSVLQQRVQNHLDAAYGLEALSPGSLDTTHDMDLNEHFASLCAGLHSAAAGGREPGRGHAAPLEPGPGARVPGRPALRDGGEVGRAQEGLRAGPAGHADAGRPGADREAAAAPAAEDRQSAALGDMGIDATYFVLGQHWKTHFARKAAETGGPMDVGHLQQVDRRSAGRWACRKEAENLVILLFAAQTNHTFYRHGGPR